MCLFEELYEGRLEIDRMNYAHVVLIPKVEGANRVQHFKPISLLNVIYKIVAKGTDHQAVY